MIYIIQSILKRLKKESEFKDGIQHFLNIRDPLKYGAKLCVICSKHFIKEGKDFINQAAGIELHFCSKKCKERFLDHIRL